MPFRRIELSRKSEPNACADKNNANPKFSPYSLKWSGTGKPTAARALSAASAGFRSIPILKRTQKYLNDSFWTASCGQRPRHRSIIGMFTLNATPLAEVNSGWGPFSNRVFCAAELSPISCPLMVICSGGGENDIVDGLYGGADFQNYQ